MAEGGIKETIDKVADAIRKLGLPLLALAFALVACALLWFSDSRLQWMKLLSFRNAHADTVPVVFWVCSVFVALNWCARLPRMLRRGESKRVIRRNALKRLQKLTPKEKGCLWEFVSQQSRTVELPMEDPTVVALTQAGLIFTPTQRVEPRLNRNVLGSPLTYPAIHHVHEVVWELLVQHPELLK